jgi:hypothetical protein
MAIVCRALGGGGGDSSEIEIATTASFRALPVLLYVLYCKIAQGRGVPNRQSRAHACQSLSFELYPRA